MPTVFRGIVWHTLAGFLLFTPAVSHAWFIFVPGSITQGISDAVTGAKGDICVGSAAKPGDVLTSPSGNTGRIKSTSGTSSMCRDARLPIRAEVEFTFSHKSNAGFDLLPEFEPTKITDLQRYNGTLLVTSSKDTKNKGILVLSQQRRPNSDLAGLARGYEQNQLSRLDNSVSRNPTELEINGARALRFEIDGKLKGIFGAEMTYLVTLIEGDSEILIMNVYAPKADFSQHRESLIKMVDSVKGLGPTVNPTVVGGDGVERVSQPAKDQDPFVLAKSRCEELGLRPGTESFGDCVVKLYSK